MTFPSQPVLPAARSMKQLERLLRSSYTHLILLDSHVSRLRPAADLAAAHGKQLLIHADLIEGLKNDEAAAEFLCQTIRPAGLLSTRASVIAKTKQNGLLAIQRIFLLDSGALEKSYALLARSQPDCIEVLPGILPGLIAEVRERTGLPVLAGGLVRTAGEVEAALAAGASAVTTSREPLWKQFEASPTP
ncbi:glycerol-3-phosphate responsive antiterminator [Paenibacillus albicereus]|uniref:Glycerol uptake operon antiterminator regulatory protein n=1 Tax=Paenibacillus albicereus TaxID=2726185 RepID=A0A6H2GUF1_9BACL|nr:glycerol-3-phosphate responsive antiterminator [Paenibacillus albicereus]QJC51040.1 glycerol-3-phosphate responsive antiterminator [Paenibacillus albicereus]